MMLTCTPIAHIFLVQRIAECLQQRSRTVVTDSGQIVVREQWNRPYKEGSSLFRFHFSVANIVQSSVAINTEYMQDVVTGLSSLNRKPFTKHISLVN